MRKPERIKELLNLIEKKWNERPDQRFGQLLICLGIAPDSMEFWSLEDDDIIKHLKNKSKTRR